MVSTSLKPAYSFSRLNVSKTAGMMRSLFRLRKSIPLSARLSILVTARDLPAELSPISRRVYLNKQRKPLCSNLFAKTNWPLWFCDWH
jgi:hypothetical protein